MMIKVRTSAFVHEISSLHGEKVGGTSEKRLVLIEMTPNITPAVDLLLGIKIEDSEDPARECPITNAQ